MTTKLSAAEIPTSESAHPAFEDIVQQLQAVRTELGQLGKVSANAAKQGLHAVGAESAEAFSEGKAKASEAAEHLTTWVRKNPLSTLALAGGVGLLCGLFATKR